MPQELRVFDDTRTSEDRARTWPYLVGLGSLLIGAVGLVFAPISGIVYIALPGVGLATYWAFACRCPVRIGVAASAGAFTLGVVALVIGFASLARMDLFFAQELGFASGLFSFPIIGLVIGFPALLAARNMPGNSPRPLKRAGLAE